MADKKNTTPQKSSPRENTAKGENGFRKSVFVAQQAIFDRAQNVQGYELLFHSKEEEDETMDADKAAAALLVDGLSLAASTVDPDSRLFINVSEEAIMEGLEGLLPAKNCVIEIAEGFSTSGSFLGACKKLKDAGYMLALDKYTGADACDQFLSMADFVKIDAADLSTPEILNVAQKLADSRERLLADRIVNEDMYKFFRALGASYYQGRFFKEPMLVEGFTLPSAKVIRLQVLARLSQSNYDVKDVAETLSADVALSYRLMRFINAAAFSLVRKIDSIEQAISLLGEEKLRQWLTMAMMVDMESDKRGREITFYCAKRAKFFETAAKHGMLNGIKPQTMFLFGMFSKLDALLNTTMEDVVEKLGLADELSEALLKRSGWAVDWLSLVDSIEEGDWDTVKKTMKKKKLNPKMMAQAYNGSAKWAASVLKLQRKSASDDKSGAEKTDKRSQGSATA